MKKVISIILLVLILVPICALLVGSAVIYASSESKITDNEREESETLSEIGNIEAEDEYQNEIAASRGAKTSSGSVLSELGIIVVTDYIAADGKADVSSEIQKIIDENPNRTIYFPDGIYLLSKPIYTPADPKKSVDLQLSNYAIIRADKNWDEGALVRLGGKDKANDIYTVGSNYSLTGGIIDGSGVADGISIDGGRETKVSNVSIKHTRIGVHIKYGANSGSSDADISDVNVVGNGKTDSIGVLIEGWDNTVTNMRIARVFTGMHIKSAGNCFRNIHPLYTCDYTDYENTSAFLDEGGNNVYDYCYNDQFCVGYKTIGGKRNVYSNCFCYWYSSKGGKEVGFKAVDGAFDSLVSNMRIDFRDDTENSVLETDKIGTGFFDNLLVDSSKSADKTYKMYKKGSLLWMFTQLF